MVIINFAKNIYIKTNNTMKTTRFLMMFVAAATMMFAACGKDDEKTTDLADNTVVYDGVTYNCTSAASYFPGGEPGFVQYVLNNQDYTVHLDGGLYQSAHNRTFDLTRHHDDLEFHFHLGIEGGVLDLQWSDNPNNFWCFLNGDSMNSSCFSSGTATVTVDDNYHLTILVDGVLINGKSLKIKIVTDAHASK